MKYTVKIVDNDGYVYDEQTVADLAHLNKVVKQFERQLQDPDSVCFGKNFLVINK